MSIDRPRITVIVPVHDGADVLPRSLSAIAASDLDRSSWELIVVDDASADDSALVAGRYADTVIKLSGQPRGPAYARNRGLELARGEIIVSVDADVCVHRDTMRLLAARLTEDATLGAVIGAYDVVGGNRGLVTSFRNLRKCYQQRRSAGDVDHYWPACGAIRRSVLSQVGHFDEWHYWRPQAEGAELGQRVCAAGFRIVLDPGIQGTHLKEWTLRSTVTTDLLNHGVPRMRLLLQGGSVGHTRAPSLSSREKMNAVFACALVLAILLHLVLPIPALSRLAAIGGIAVLFGTAPFFAFLAAERGPVFALLCVPLHLLHYLMAGASVVLAWVLHQLVGEPKRDVTDDAFAEIGLDTWPPIPRRLATDAWKQPAEKA
jgi:GT2 family glycosyltransferase